MDRNTDSMGNRLLVGTRRTLRGTFYDKYHRHKSKSKFIHLLEVKQMDVGVNKMDCDIADSKQYKISSVRRSRIAKRTPTTRRNFGANPDRVSWKWYEWYEWNERDDSE